MALRATLDAVEPQTRYPGLDGLRGLAAFSVFLSHVVGMLPAGRVPQRIVDSPLHFLWDGTAAVDLFFVLSGYVLALPFVGGPSRWPQYAKFVLRRIFRIYPAYWTSLALAWALCVYGFAPAGLSGASAWSRHFWTTPITLKDAIAHAILIGPSFNTSALDPVIWSLVVEMRMSLLFPLILLALQRVHTWWQGLAVWLAAVAVSALTLRLGNGTLQYLPLFILGGLLALFRTPLNRWLRSRGTASLIALALVALILYDIRFALFGYRFNYYVADLVVAMGSALLILLAANCTMLARLLSTRAVAFLGTVSYSFYLVHFPIMLFVTSRLHPFIGSLEACTLIALVLSWGVSSAVYMLVERPFLALGRVVAELPYRGTSGDAARRARYAIAEHAR